MIIPLSASFGAWFAALAAAGKSEDEDDDEKSLSGLLTDEEE